MQHLSRYAGHPDLRVAEFISTVIHRDFKMAQNAGGLGLVFTLVAMALALCRLTAGSGSAEWRKTLALLLATLFLQCALLHFVLPVSGMNRAVMIVPYALLCAGVATSHFGSVVRRFAGVAAIAAAVMQLGVAAIYLGELRHSGEARSAGRFDALVSAIPAENRVAGPPEFWFAFRRHNRPFAVIYHSIGEDAYWNGPHALDGYDAVILDPGWPAYKALHNQAAEGRAIEYRLNSSGRYYTVVAKNLDKSSLPGE
jgi:hypothetical protein